jgi:hypothetical protein
VTFNLFAESQRHIGKQGKVMATINEVTAENALT